MKQLLPTSGYKVRFAVPLKVRRAAGRTALFSVKSVTANNTQNYNNKKAAGPERPASAAGIGPFRASLCFAGTPGGAAAFLKQRRMNMPLIASEPQGKKSALRFEIDSDTKQTLKLYCEFSENLKHDPVIVGALKLLFKSDADFTPWLEQRKRQQAASPKAAGQPKPEQK
jgi:hypothetical protein